MPTRQPTRQSTDTSADRAVSAPGRWLRCGWRPLVCVAVLLGVSGLSGCVSDDTHKIESTAFAPKTVTVVDGLTGEVLWTIDVPPNQTLDLDFNSPQGGEMFSRPKVAADSLTYELKNTVDGGTIESRTIELTGEPQFQITVTKDDEPVVVPATQP